jgi:hypothetical protein
MSITRDRRAERMEEPRGLCKGRSMGRQGNREADGPTLTVWPSYHWGSGGHTPLRPCRTDADPGTGCYAVAMSFRSAVVSRGHATHYVRLRTNINKVGACDGAHPFLATDGSGPLPEPSVAISAT